MGQQIYQRLKSLLIAAHFGPTVLVVTITFLISLARFDALDALRIALAIFAGQLVVGWSNDVIDYPLDKAADRLKKPLVSGRLQLETLKRLIPLALVVAAVLSYFSPLRLIGTLVHLLGLLSATMYNAKLKATIFSPIPYLISFGALPWAIYLAADQTPPLWLYLALALFTTSFHFLNVLKDLQWDIDQGILGLPQRFGRRKSVITAIVLAIGGVALVITAL